MRPTDADALMPLFIEKANKMKDRHGVKLGEEWLLNYDDIKDVIDNAPTVEPELSYKQIEQITDLLETEWGYEGIKEDVARILRGGTHDE